MGIWGVSPQASLPSLRQRLGQQLNRDFDLASDRVASVRVVQGNPSTRCIVGADSQRIIYELMRGFACRFCFLGYALQHANVSVGIVGVGVGAIKRGLREPHDRACIALAEIAQNLAHIIGGRVRRDGDLALPHIKLAGVWIDRCSQ